MLLTKLLLPVTYVRSSGIVFICILQQSFAVVILLTNSTVQINHTNGSALETPLISNSSRINSTVQVNHTNGAAVGAAVGTPLITNSSKINSTVKVNHTNGSAVGTPLISNSSRINSTVLVNHKNGSAVGTPFISYSSKIKSTVKINHTNGSAVGTPLISNSSRIESTVQINHTNGSGVGTSLISNSTISNNTTDFSIATRSLKRKRYFISSIKASWFRAMQSCRETGMRLASINNERQQKMLTAAIRRSDVGINPVWTSGTDFGQTGKFYWISTGQDFIAAGYRRWRPGQPDNRDWGSTSGVEHCVEVSAAHKYFWSDYTCYAKQYFACEYF